MKIKRKELRNLIKRSKGRFFTVVFIKKEGDERRMTCKLLENQDFKGNYLKVSDMALPKGNIRTINLETTKSLNINKMKYKVEG